MALSTATRTIRLAALWLVISACSSDRPGDTPQQATRSIPYTVVEQWTIPAGGFGKVIVVDSAFRTADKLRAVGEQLNNDSKGDAFASAFIYDDARAASLRRAAINESLSNKEAAFHDLHMIGSYIKNKKMGFNELNAFPTGISGDAVKFTY